MTDDEFIDTWIAWDKRPSDTTTSLHMVDACQETAGQQGLHPVRFRETLAAGRRAGLTYHEAYDAAILVNKMAEGADT
jgi:hypothetical protein